MIFTYLLVKVPEGAATGSADPLGLTFFLVSVLTMLAVGYHFGITGAGSFWITLVLTLSFSAIILLIADLDRPRGGLINVSQEPMVELQQKLRSSAE
jgi:hypothetical protein